MQPDDRPPSCPKHDTYMIPNSLDIVEVALPHGVEVFRCPNLRCSIIYATGVLEGFYTFESKWESYSMHKRACGTRQLCHKEKPLICSIPQIKGFVGGSLLAVRTVPFSATDW